MNKYLGFTNQDYQRQIEECFQGVQNQIESSFNNIDAYLDSLLNETSDSLNVQDQKSLENSQYTSQINWPQFKLNDAKFVSQLSQDIQPIIKTKINNQLLLKEQQLQINISQKCEQQIRDIQKSMEQKLIDKEILLEQKNKEIECLNSKLNIKEQQTIQSTHSINLKPFNYQIIQQSSISQNDWCYAIAFDNDCSTLVAGCESQIKVYEFKQGIIKEIQTLNEHQSRVFTLNFMKKSKQFISGSVDKSIRIWKQNQNYLWSSLQILNGHNGVISCLVLNINEDLIISGSHDNTIKFWIKKNEWLCQQTITDHSDSVYGLSLNQQQNRIVSCGDDKLILIIENQGQNTEWKVIQKININNYGLRVCFIDNNMFTLSQYNQEYISVFEMNNINKQFTKTRDITIKCGSDCNCLFPQQYINQKCILLSKNGEYVNLIRKKQNGEFLTEQSIHFATYSIFGGMSEDGQYLITWDKQSCQIQIRKYHEL
ncbi:unnamed protein product [Paramecium pentaurelia]|uniref:WD40-repeat-containing domain n=1 Tax=Paramecium pentaurelia TaxID=43138 RepID=A0A8S1XTC1_9CILI|nr:unnamed protein product [Paramecium pentaurelia]